MMMLWLGCRIQYPLSRLDYCNPALAGLLQVTVTELSCSLIFALSNIEQVTPRLMQLHWRLQFKVCCIIITHLSSTGCFQH